MKTVGDSEEDGDLVRLGGRDRRDITGAVRRSRLAVLGVLLAGGLFAQTCSSTVTVTSAVTTQATICLQTGGTFTVDGSSGSTVVFQAGTAVILLPGFTAQAGSSGTAFIAQIWPAQTISFSALSTMAFGAAPFTVSATASSGLTVSFTSGTTAVCTVSGNAVTLVGVGSCEITASQAGSANFAPATPVIQSFTVTQGTLSSLTKEYIRAGSQVIAIEVTR
jgi:hypothetical protein